jgi:hypothetical protein
LVQPLQIGALARGVAVGFLVGEIERRRDASPLKNPEDVVTGFIFK